MIWKRCAELLQEFNPNFNLPVLFFISAIVGFVFGCLDRKKQSVDNYYFGGRQISPIPVAISIAVSFISAITVIGGPTEVYLYGNVYGWFPISVLVPTIFGIVYYIPLIHRLQVSSSYEYLELRFHRRVRIVASALGILNITAFLGVAVFIPSLALTAVTPLNLSWTIALTSFTCTLYTTLGGMKAVIWTDVLQSFIMLAGMSVIFFRIVAEVGGLGSVQAAATRGGRDNFLNFDFDPRVRRSAAMIFIGGSVASSYELLCNQIYIQRWLSCKTINSARMAVFFSLIPLLFFYVFSIGNGLGMYAYYEGCDPILSGEITRPDQLIPRLAVSIFRNYSGLPGLFVSAAFCGTLSSVSSGLNALSALVLIDMIVPAFPRITSRSKVIISKGLTVLFGTITMILSYALTQASANVLQINHMLFGYFAGPFLGVYTMGIMMPWMNSKGAVAGLASGFLFNAWVGASSMLSTYVAEGSEKLSLAQSNCSTMLAENQTFTTALPFTSAEINLSDSGSSMESQEYGILETTLYSISPYLYGPVGLLVCVLCAHITCLFCGFDKPSEADPGLFLPLLDSKVFPRKVRTFFRFSVPEISDAEKEGYTKGASEREQSTI